MAALSNWRYAFAGCHPYLMKSKWMVRKVGDVFGVYAVPLDEKTNNDRHKTQQKPKKKDSGVVLFFKRFFGRRRNRIEPTED